MANIKLQGILLTDSRSASTGGSTEGLDQQKKESYTGSYSPKMSKRWRNVLTLAAFWIFGLCNNYAYVIMLSAAEDILNKQEHVNSTRMEDKCEKRITSRLCSSMTTGAVLLADILPCFFVKLTFPFFMHRLPFGLRHLIICAVQAASYFIVAFSTSVATSLVGVVFASLSSGFGEITYLAFTPYFGKNSISAWSSGTGGAGIIGSFAYAALTEPHLANLSPSTALLVMLVVPVIFYASWFLVVVPESVHHVEVLKPKTWLVPSSSFSSDSVCDNSSIEKQPAWSEISAITNDVKQRKLSFVEKLFVTLPLLKYMVPLMLVYLGEYLINQGIVELIFFNCDHGWNLSRSSQYRWYQVLYQLGVFVSRSSINLIQLPYWALVLLPIFQLGNTLLFFFNSLHFFIPHVWILFILILFEGLFGGSSYVNTFTHIHNFAKPDVREFSMSISSLGDSIGIVTAGFLSIPLHNHVCSTPLPKHVIQ